MSMTHLYKHFNVLILMKHFDETFDESYWWGILIIHFSEIFLRDILWDILERHFDESFNETFWWGIGMRYFDEIFWWNIW